MRTARDEADAIALANDTDAGLSRTSTRATARAQARAAEALDAGMVGVNEGLVSTAQAPFGGIKHSGPRPRGLAPRPRRLHATQVRRDYFATVNTPPPPWVK